MSPEAAATPESDWLHFHCLEVTQPIGTFYVTVMKTGDVVRLSYNDVRRISTERREVETYLGIERPLNPRRVADIADYVETTDASFPSAVIFAVQPENASYDPQSGILSLRDRQDIAKILDGQHRIAGLEQYKGSDFNLIVTVFVDMDIENQALLFGTINLEQTKVSKSLAYDLFEYAKTRSPQKAAHNIVVLLDSEPESPFLGKIKRLGRAEERGETLSQAVFVDALLVFVSHNAMKDRDLLKRGRRPERASPGDERGGLIFRNMFLDERDAEITKVLWNYFRAVQDRWPEDWDEVRPGNVLNRTTGFRALMGFLPHAYLLFVQPGEVPDQSQFKELFDRVQLQAGGFNPDTFKPGSAGQTALRKRLLADAGFDSPS